MDYLSLFSGMEAAHLAWLPLGWRCKGVAEIDPAACALLISRGSNSTLQTLCCYVVHAIYSSILGETWPANSFAVEIEVDCGWTLVPNAAGKPMADGPRYKMLGNSFAVPVIRWIGESIQRAHTWAQQELAA